MAFRGRSLIYDHEPSIIENPKACLRRLSYPTRTFAVAGVCIWFSLASPGGRSADKQRETVGRTMTLANSGNTENFSIVSVYTKVCTLSLRVRSTPFHLVRFYKFSRRLIHCQSMTMKLRKFNSSDERSDLTAFTRYFFMPG